MGVLLALGLIYLGALASSPLLIRVRSDIAPKIEQLRGPERYIGAATLLLGFFYTVDVLRGFAVLGYAPGVFFLGVLGWALAIVLGFNAAYPWMEEKILMEKPEWRARAGGWRGQISPFLEALGIGALLVGFALFFLSL